MRTGGDARRSIPSRVVRVLLTVLIFVAVGPPVGAMFFMLSVALVGLGRDVDLGGLVWIGLFSLIYAVPLSYLLGAVPAAASGFLVGLKRELSGTVGWRFALVAGAIVGLGLVIISGQSFRPASTESGPPSNVILAATCLFSTVFCWAVERNLHSR